MLETKEKWIIRKYSFCKLQRNLEINIFKPLNSHNSEVILRLINPLSDMRNVLSYSELLRMYLKSLIYRRVYSAKIQVSNFYLA